MSSEGPGRRIRRVAAQVAPEPVRRLARSLRAARASYKGGEAEASASAPEKMPAAAAAELARLGDLVVAQRSQLLAISRRLAVLEDRLLEPPSDRPVRSSRPRAR